MKLQSKKDLTTTATIYVVLIASSKKLNQEPPLLVLDHSVIKKNLKEKIAKAMQHQEIKVMQGKVAFNLPKQQKRENEVSHFTQPMRRK